MSPIVIVIVLVVIMLIVLVVIVMSTRNPNGARLELTADPLGEMDGTKVL